MQNNTQVIGYFEPGNCRKNGGTQSFYFEILKER